MLRTLFWNQIAPLRPGHNPGSEYHPGSNQPMTEYSIGMDVHKKTISFCAKRADGPLVKRGRIPARRRPIRLGGPLTSHWVYDHLRELGCDAKIGQPCA
jgi:hypothetical protein